ncbi:MAG TPA: phytanoyl-CoA dioxygenase family protein [Hanamia sp.]|nr:phytanoyl-CoA dioxygenase family protein [Hanamia sp.]
MFKWPRSVEEWEQYKLTNDQIDFYKHNGYLADIKLLDKTQVNTLNNELKEIMDPCHPLHSLLYEFHSNESEDPETILFHCLGHWRIKEGFHDVLWNPSFIMAASQLLGNSNVRLWHDQLFCKPAFDGGVVAWHQDYSYWKCTKPIQHLTCWTALDDSTRDNGCLHYVPGSHLWGLLPNPELAGKMDGLMGFLNKEQKAQFNPIPIEIKKGYAVFHHPLLVHGSFENKSSSPRRALVINVFKDGTLSNSNDVVLEGVPAIKNGAKMEGQFYPLLFDKRTIFS